MRVAFGWFLIASQVWRSVSSTYLWTSALVASFHDAALYACFDTTQQRDRSVRELIDLEQRRGQLDGQRLLLGGLTRDVSDSSRTTLDKYGHAASVIAKTSSSLGPPPSSLRADLFLRGYARPVRQPGIGRRENLPAERHFRNDIVVIPSVNNGTLSGSIGRIVRKRPTRGTSEGAGTARLRPSETPLE